MLPVEDVKMLVDNHLKKQKALIVVKAWLETDSSFLVMLGFSGCGKTVASGYMLANKGGVYVHARSLERIFAASFGEQLEQQERIKSARYAVIDDLDTEDDPRRFVGMLYEVIDARQSKRTIFTSNVNRKRFDSIYGDVRIQRRLERAKFVVIKS